MTELCLLTKQVGLNGKRRNSLPPLIIYPQKTDCALQTTNADDWQSNSTMDNWKLPSINASSPDLTNKGDGDRLQVVNDTKPSTSQANLKNESIFYLERDLEEAEGIVHSERYGEVYSGNTEEITEIYSIESIKRLDDLNLCGLKQINIPERQMCRKKSDETLLDCQLSLLGNKAKCSTRPVTRNSARDRSSRSIQFNSNKSSMPRASKTNSMVSMEERLARNAQANSRSKMHQQRSVSAKSKKRRCSNTAVVPTKRNVCLLTCIKPSNLMVEKQKFMKSGFTYNPQFTYEYPASEKILTRYNRASSQYLPQAMAIMKRVLERYGNYEKFEWATGGQLLSKTQLWNMVKRYLQKEGFYGDVVVNISNDLIARAAMTVNAGRPTLSIRENAAKKYWIEGLLRHEVGTHHLRFHNNRQQIWNNVKIRRQLGMKPANPTEEGLASLHSVLLRKDPSLWRSAILYYTIQKASILSFCELFKDLGKYMDDPEVRWDYCLRSKRGQYDTSKPGCFCKDQVYLTGILEILQIRHTLDFHLLCTMGKISYKDMEMLKPHYKSEETKIPGFMKDLTAYRSRLDHIVEVNGLEEWLASMPPKTDTFEDN